MHDKAARQLLKPLKKIQLSRETKALHRIKLTSLMRAQPLSHTRKAVPSTCILSAFNHRRTAFAGILVFGIVAIFGTGIALASDTALPGDILYPMKTHVNERLRGILIFSPAAKLAWEGELIKRRLDEADALAQEKKLDDATRQSLQDSIDDHSTKRQLLMEVLALRGNDEALKQGREEAQSFLTRGQFIRITANREGITISAYDERLDVHSDPDQTLSPQNDSEKQRTPDSAVKNSLESEEALLPEGVSGAEKENELKKASPLDEAKKLKEPEKTIDTKEKAVTKTIEDMKENVEDLVPPITGEL